MPVRQEAGLLAVPARPAGGAAAESSGSVARWPWPPPNNSKQAVSKNNLRWEIRGGESGRE